MRFVRHYNYVKPGNRCERTSRVIWHVGTTGSYGWISCWYKVLVILLAIFRDRNYIRKPILRLDRLTFCAEGAILSLALCNILFIRKCEAEVTDFNADCTILFLVCYERDHFRWRPGDIIVLEFDFFFCTNFDNTAVPTLMLCKGYCPVTAGAVIEHE